jgi:hypothetical protein
MPDSKFAFPAVTTFVLEALGAILAIALLLITVKPEAHAVPSYSRQTGLSCTVICGEPIKSSNGEHICDQSFLILPPRAFSFVSQLWLFRSARERRPMPPRFTRPIARYAMRRMAAVIMPPARP